MQHPKVSILIPHYKTLELTKLCLNLIKKFTDPELAKIIVIENGSQDDSIEYLKKIAWIDLIERKAETGESPIKAHARALDVALDQVNTPYVLSIHTDTLVKHPGWLHFLIQQLESHENIAGVGSWKLEVKSIWQQLLKQIERNLQRVEKKSYYLRSHCALYKMDLLRKFNLHFADNDMVAGKALYNQLVAEGYEMKFLAAKQLFKYLEHINHATTILTPGLSRRKNLSKDMRKVNRNLARFQTLL